MNFKELIFLTIKTFLMLCFIIISTTVLLSWNTEQPTSEKNQSLEHIYKPIVEQEKGAFFVREDVTSIIREVNMQSFYYNITNNRIISSTILEKAQEYNVPVNLVFAIAKVESNFNPSAINHNSNSTDYGLFQLNNSYRNWSTNDFFNIRRNTDGGISYLKEMLNLFNGDVLRAIAAYNCGPQRVMNNRVPESTERYVIRVLAAEDELNVRFNNYLLEEGIVLNRNEEDE